MLIHFSADRHLTNLTGTVFYFFCVFYIIDMESVF